MIDATLSRADGAPSETMKKHRPETLPGFDLHDELGRGGMGVVYRARDVALDRDVAVKLLSERYPADSLPVQRFLSEARITGQLQHPGIPAVHQVGTLADGRPFLAMKLIKGSTLEAILRDRPDASADRGRLLAIFEAVCQAVGYAHAHHVIHRDLKPANVMVGAFGEVQVMDWGLAKVLGEEAPATTEAPTAEQTQAWSVIHPTPDTGSYTQAGSLVGTPAFIPPEQAVGQIERVNERSDVFGLGALLAVILTGKPPYTGEADETVRVQAVRGKLDDCFTRLDAADAEPELVTLCKRCLAFDPAERPADAGAVAAAVAGLRAAADERAQTAQREHAVALARETEQRKRRKVQLALAGAIALLVLGGGTVAWWLNEQAGARRETDLRRQLEDEQRSTADHARLGRNAEAVAVLLGQCADALRADDAAKAQVALDAAKKRSAEGGAEQEADRLRRREADLTLLHDLNVIEQNSMPFAEHRILPAEVAPRTRAALTRFGADPDAVSADEAAARVTASVVRERVVWALDRLLRQEKAAGMRALLRRVDADPYRDAVRDAVQADDRAKLVELAEQNPALEQPAGFAAFLGETTLIPVERRRQLLQAAVSRRSGNLGLLMTMAGTYPLTRERTKEVDEPLRWYQAAAAASPNNYKAHLYLGIILCDYKRDFDGAIACFKKAIDINPNLDLAQHNLGIAYRGKGQVDEAIACFRKVIENDKMDIPARFHLGMALSAKGQVDEAIALFRKVVEIAPPHAGAHFHLGIALSGKGQGDEAIVCFRKAVEIDPRNAAAYHSLGIELSRKGEGDEAIACLQQAIAIDPNLPNTHGMLGLALLEKGRYAEARDATARALELVPDQGPRRAFVAQQLQTCERFLKLETRLPRLLTSEDRPASAGERLEVVTVCRHKRMNAAAARFSEQAFAADPKLADNLKNGHRYNAACCAALAATGQGEDAAKLDDREKARLRKQALDWLRADLVLHTKQLEGGQPAERTTVQKVLRHWQQDADLAGIRDAAALLKLPADEPNAFTQLWADVAALLKRAGAENQP